MVACAQQQNGPTDRQIVSFKPSVRWKHKNPGFGYMTDMTPYLLV